MKTYRISLDESFVWSSTIKCERVHISRLKPLKYEFMSTSWSPWIKQNESPKCFLVTWWFVISQRKATCLGGEQWQESVDTNCACVWVREGLHIQIPFLELFRIKLSEASVNYPAYLHQLILEWEMIWNRIVLHHWDWSQQQLLWLQQHSVPLCFGETVLRSGSSSNLMVRTSWWHWQNFQIQGSPIR
jgi:hypothetical protein